MNCPCAPGTILLAGGISDGHALRAARELGADLGYMGTRLIAAEESMAAADYERMLVASELDDVVLTAAFTGLPASILAPSIRAHGLDPGALDELISPDDAAALYGARAEGEGRAAGPISAAPATPSPASARSSRRRRSSPAPAWSTSQSGPEPPVSLAACNLSPGR